MMKIDMITLTLAAASFIFFPIGSADAAMYVDSEERRNAIFGTFVLMSALMGGLCALVALVPRKAETGLEPSSVVVPPIKQESNIVQHLITA